MSDDKSTVYENKSMKDINIACIFDVFTYACFKDVCNFIKIKPDSWRETFEKKDIDFFMIESVWKGNDGTWISGRSLVNNKTLKEVIKYCNENKIPTVFLNKEDPANFKDFINVAKLFDYIFTSDVNMITEYEKYVDHKNIYPLMFCANPKTHNPIKILNKRIDKSCFAGSFYRESYEQRAERMKLLLDLAAESTGLDIYDRNLNLNIEKYKYPDEYNQYIKGNLTQDEIQIANKGYKIMLNVNIVDNSSTMFARRVFEGLASYTPVISTASIGVKEVFEGLVIATDNKEKLREEFIKLNDKSYYEEKALKGMRLVLNNHTCLNRMDYILNKLNIDHIYPDLKISIISQVKNEEEYIRVKEIFENQIYKNKKMFVITNKELKSKLNTEKDIYIMEEEVLENKEKFISLLDADYVSVIKTENFYGINYLNDLINATLYSDAEFIGKKCFFTYNNPTILTKLTGEKIYINNENQEFEYVSLLDLDKSIFKIDVLKHPSIKDIKELLNNNIINLFKFGCRYLSIDKYNFLENGYKASENIKEKIEI